MVKRSVHKAKTVLNKMHPKNALKNQSTARIIQKLADDIGMVYFGYVDQRDDEHKLLRGITVSNNHDDYHFDLVIL